MRYSIILWILFALMILPRPAEPSEPGPVSNLAANLGTDLRGLASRQNLLWLAVGSGAAWGAYQIEDPDGAQRAFSRGILDPIADSGNIYGDFRLQAPLVLSVWGWGHWRGRSGIEDLGYDLTRALLLNSAVLVGLKPAVDRERPNGERYSFPSGHTAMAFCAAGVVSRHAGSGWTGAAVGAGIVTALGRMEARKHYASDTVAGATIGWIVGRTVGRRPDPGTDSNAWRLEPYGRGLVLARRF